MPKASTKAPARAIASEKTVSLSIKPSDFKTHAAKELYDVTDAFRTARDVLVGLNCQPRYGRDNSTSANSAGETVERVIEWFDSAIELLRDTAGALSTDDATQLLYKWMVPISLQASYCDDLHLLAKMSIEAADAVSSAKLVKARTAA